MAQGGDDRLQAACAHGAPEGIERVLAHEAPARPGAVADEIDAARDARDGGARQAHLQVAPEVVGDGRHAVVGLRAIQANQHEVIDVARVVPDAEIALDEVIKRIKVNEPAQLTHQAADRQADAGRLGVTRIGKLHPQINKARILDFALDLPAQNRVPDAVVVPAHIELHEVAVARHLLQGALDVVGRGVRTLARPACKRGVDEAAIEDRAHNAVERMLHNPVPEGGRADLARLGLIDPEVVVPARLIGAGLQLLVQRLELGAQAALKREDRSAAALTGARIEIALMQRLRRSRQGVQIAHAFHRKFLR